MKLTQSHLISGGMLLILSLLLCVLAGKEFQSMHHNDPIYPSSDLTAAKKLSDYFSALKGSPGDTDIYIFSGAEPGGSLLILGGSHPNEPAGFITAVLAAENIQVQKGKVVIIPQANLSGFTHNDPFEGNPQRFPIATPSGDRWFRYGSRLTNPVHQWPDPALYRNPAGQKLAGTEFRNLNRNYPGRSNGGLTEKIAFGIMQLIDQEHIDMAIDLHEAAPEYPVINAIVFHENSAELAAIALMELQLEGIELRLEESPKNLRGLSHREWGDSAGIEAFLLETANASHGRLKGKPSTALILDGKDENYVKAGRLGRLFVPFDENGIPLEVRTARHVATVKALVASHNEINTARSILFNGLPDPDTLKKAGIGAFLKPPN